MTISVIGLGLIGGSFAKAIKKLTSHRVLGFDKNAETLDRAYKNGVIDDICTGFSDTDIAIVALNPNAAVDFISANAHKFKHGMFVIDVCGVKRYVVDSLDGIVPDGVIFIGGHPMAGRECWGFENSSESLFSGATMILTPDEDIPIDELDVVSGFFTELGFSHMEFTSTGRHDEMIAYTSQLAHIVSSAYVNSPLAKKAAGFSAGSFADMTRVASLNEKMWAELFLLNGDHLCGQIEQLTENLKKFSDAISNRDEKALREMLRAGRKIKQALNEEV